LRLVTQVGCSGYRIDLAARDPEQPDRYVLGIECDGRSYHSSKTARDRDRLRQAHLESLGWTIHRIWSSDWFANPEREIEKALRAFTEARERHSGGASKRVS
jgi:very-short-patch-repair endonuclease